MEKRGETLATVDVDVEEQVQLHKSCVAVPSLARTEPDRQLPTADALSGGPSQVSSILNLFISSPSSFKLWVAKYEIAAISFPVGCTVLT